MSVCSALFLSAALVADFEALLDETTLAPAPTTAAPMIATATVAPTPHSGEFHRPANRNNIAQLQHSRGVRTETTRPYGISTRRTCAVPRDASIPPPLP